WTFSANSGVTSDPVHSGTHAAFVNNGATISQSVATTTGTTYTIDFFARPQVNGQNLSINFGSTVFNYLFTGPGYHEVTFNATATGASTNLSFHDPTGGFFVFIDDVSVEPTGVGVPDGGTTVSLLGCALFGLAAVRRKLG